MKFTLKGAGEFTCNLSRPVNDVDLRSSFEDLIWAKCVNIRAEKHHSQQQVENHAE